MDRPGDRWATWWASLGCDGEKARPDDWVNDVGTQASNASKDTNPNMETQRLRSDMAHRFANDTTRSLLKRAPRCDFPTIVRGFSGWPSETHDAALYPVFGG